MAYVVVNEKGKKQLNDEFKTMDEAKQAQLNMIYGAKLGNTKKGNADALKYMEFKIKKA